MKSHLPPLYQTQTSNKYTGFTDISYKLSLIDKARVTLTTIELNEILKELQVIYQSDIETFSKLEQTLQLKKTQYLNDKDNYNKLQTNYNTLKSNTLFLQTLKNNNLKYQIDELIKSINEIDLERKAQHSPPMSVDPQLVISKNETDILKFLHLKELNYREFEVLIYLLKKRALSIDKSNECIGTVNKKYKSISNLIELTKILQEENKQLKNFEKSYIQDPLTKRQLFARLSPYGNQSMIITLQSTIQNYYQFSKNLNATLPMNEGQNFESVCTDQEFKQKELSFKTESSEHTLVPLEEAFEQLQDQYDKMNSSEILSCQLIPHNFIEISTSRLDKLIKSNAELLDNMRKIHLRYENAINGISDITKQMMNMLTEKRKSECLIAYSESKLKNLTNDHIKLINDQYQNRAKLKTLENLISTAGISLISQPNQIIKTAVMDHLDLDQSTTSTTDNKKRKQSMLKIKQTSEIKNCSNNLNLLCNQSPNILFEGLEIAFQITDFERSRQKSDYLTNLKSSLSELKNSFSSSINNMEDFLKNQLNLLKTANTINLRKELVDEEINTNLTTKTDNYCQTEDLNSKKK